jgi:hypothetical protein
VGLHWDVAVNWQSDLSALTFIRAKLSTNVVVQAPANYGKCGETTTTSPDGIDLCGMQEKKAESMEA